MVGFCFGGGLVWQLLASGTQELSAAVPFYGPLPDNPDFGGSKRAAVLAFYGALDKRVTGSEAAAKAALDRAGLINDIVVEPECRPCVFQRHRTPLQRCRRRGCLAAGAGVVRPLSVLFGGGMMRR